MKIKLPILTYHKIGIPPKNAKIKGLYTSPYFFEKQIVFLKKKGFSFIDFQDLKLNKLPEKPILLTFDGHEDNYDHAFSIAKKHNIKITIFVVAGDLGKKNVVWKESAESLPTNLFSWRQANEMSNSGSVDIQSHGLTHRHFEMLSDDELNNEFFISEKLFEKNMGYKPNIIAFPYGSFNERTLQACKKLKYDFACTTIKGINDLTNFNKFTLRRISVKGHKWRHFFTFKYKVRTFC